MIDPPVPYMIASAEMDFLTLFEHEQRPPIAFRDLTGLEGFQRANDLHPIRIGRRRLTNVRVLTGKVKIWGWGDLHYTQVWARAGYRGYRRAVEDHVRHSEGRQDPLRTHDVDHAVSRTALLRVWPQAWVNLLYVTGRINRGVGALMERHLKIDADATEVLFNAEALIKTFLRRDGRLRRAEIPDYLAKAAQRCLHDQRDPHGRIYQRCADEILNRIADDYSPGLRIRPRLNRPPAT